MLDALRGSNSSFADSAYTKGVLLMREGRFHDAVTAFDEALEIRPGFVDALSNRATSLSELKRYDEALQGFDAALAIDAEHAISWNNRANTLAAMKRFEEAVEQLRPRASARRRRSSKRATIARMRCSS